MDKEKLAFLQEDVDFENLDNVSLAMRQDSFRPAIDIEPLNIQSQNFFLEALKELYKTRRD